MSLISAGIAVASVVVNDYFDLKLDTTNAPDKPLPSGEGLEFGRLDDLYVPVSCVGIIIIIITRVSSGVIVHEAESATRCRLGHHQTNSAS
jgi:hypothetical protein